MAMVMDIKITESLIKWIKVTSQNYAVLTPFLREVSWGTLSRVLSNWFLSVSEMETPQYFFMRCYSAWLPSQQNSVL